MEDARRKDAAKHAEAVKLAVEAARHDDASKHAEAVKLAVEAARHGDAAKHAEAVKLAVQDARRDEAARLAQQDTRSKLVSRVSLTVIRCLIILAPSLNPPRLPTFARFEF